MMPGISHKVPLFFVNCFVSLLLLSFSASAQEAISNKPIKVVLLCIDNNTFNEMPADTSLKVFANNLSALDFANEKLQLLKDSGYVTASIDEYEVKDSFVIVKYFRGVKYGNIEVKISPQWAGLIKEIAPSAHNKYHLQLNISLISSFKEKILNHFEQSGYPFAKVALDSINVMNGIVTSLLKIDKGPLYQIDSIRLLGKAKLSSSFLQHYLFIPNGTVYKKEKLERVDKLMNDLSYIKILQPSDLTLLGRGAILNVYADPQKSSQANVLFGFQPNPQDAQKVQLTGDVNLQFKNLLGNGEDLVFKWQQLQYKSPRLNIGFSQTAIFRSYYGFDFLFDFFKKDSSFIQLNVKTGIRLSSSPYQQLKLMLQLQQNTLLPGSIDTAYIRQYKKLPNNIDAGSTGMGFGYEWNKTDYNNNPRKGNIIAVSLIGGLKKIKRNSDIESIKDTAFRYTKLYDSINLKPYQFRNNFSVTRYIPLFKASTLKLSLSGGWYWSPEIFRNDLFQIGGFKTIRGFDEESIFASSYAIFNMEYRRIISRNSYLCLFSDLAKSKLKYQDVDTENNLISVGAGIQYETNAGIFNLLLAAGRRDGINANLRQAVKIHLGYVNYF